MTIPVNAAILVGGQSRRLGIDKTHLRWGVCTLLERVIAAATPVAETVILVANSAAGFSHLGLPVHTDLQENCGPLGGLHTALRAYPGHTILLLSCDLPFLTPSFLAFLVARLGRYDVLLPHDERGLQPLCAVYAPTCIPVVEAAITAGQLSLRDLCQTLDASILHPPAWQHVNPDKDLLANINTPADLEQWRPSTTPTAISVGTNLCRGDAGSERSESQIDYTENEQHGQIDNGSP